MDLIKGFFVCICVFTLFGGGSAIRCIDCSSLNNSMCLDPSIYDQETIRLYLGSVECAAGIYTTTPKDFFCRKIVQTVLHKYHDPEIRVTRGCGWVRDDRRRECYKADNEDHTETVCSCFTDHCNGSIRPEVNLGILGLLGCFLVVSNIQ